MAGAMPSLDRSALRALLSSVQILIATGISGLLAYGTQAIIARSLGPAEYGLAGTLLATYNFVFLLLAPATVAITGVVAAAVGRQEDRRLAGAIRATAVVSLLAAVVLTLTLLVIRPLIDSAWRIEDPAVSLLFSLLLVVGLFVACAQAVLRGLQAMPFLSGVIVADPIVRLGLILVPGVLAGGTLAVLGSFAAGALVALIVGLAGFQRWLRLPGERPRRADVVGMSAGAILLALTFGLAHQAPLAVARATLGGVETGHFAVVVTLSALLLLAAEPIGSVLYPMVTAAAQRQADTRPILLASAGLMLATIGGGAALLWLFAGPIVSIAFGEEYAPAAMVLGSYAGSRALWVVVVFVASYALARGRLLPVGLAAGAAVVQVGLLLIWGQSVAGIALAGWVGAAIGVLATGAASLWGDGRAVQWSAAPAADAAAPSSHP